jgi:pseudouridine synthase
MHPRWEIEREYRVETSGPFDEARLARAARRGIDLEEGRAGPFRARVLERSGERRTLELVLREGKKREVRRIVEACGGRVERLVRTRFAFMTLTGLPSGRWRRLDREEMARLLALVDLPADQARPPGGDRTWT